MQLNTAKRASFDEGSLDQYLREISQYPLITREEEVTLAQRIKQNDPEALDKLVRSNLRFVVSVAKKYQNQGVSLSDLINEGNLGLIRAAHKFDETKGIKFISYAVFCLKKKKKYLRFILHLDNLFLIILFHLITHFFILKPVFNHTSTLHLSTTTIQS